MFKNANLNNWPICSEGNLTQHLKAIFFTKINRKYIDNTENLDQKYFIFILNIFNPKDQMQKNKTKNKYRTEFYNLFDLNYEKIKYDKNYTFEHVFKLVKESDKEKIRILNILIQKWQLEVEI